MRQQLWRSLRRSQRLAKLDAARGFSSSVRRPAEVELTVDGKKVSIEGGYITAGIAHTQRLTR